MAMPCVEPEAADVYGEAVGVVEGKMLDVCKPCQ